MPVGAGGVAEGAEAVLPPAAFRAYDVRGRVGEQLTEASARWLGRGFGAGLCEAGTPAVVVGRDGRLSSRALQAALVEGLVAAGCRVWDVGEVPTPLVHFAARHHADGNGVMVTASHNPPTYNGFKLSRGGRALAGEALLGLRRRILAGRLAEGDGDRAPLAVIDDYRASLVAAVRLARPLRVAVDCGNGVTGHLLPGLLAELGAEVEVLNGTVDGRFPAHHPDPGRPENLVQLAGVVRRGGFDLGLAFDGDGDRLGVVDGEGAIIWPDRVLMLFAADVLRERPGGRVLFDVKSSRHLAAEIRRRGGEPVMWKSGHSCLHGKLRESGALLAGELSGHSFFAQGWYGFDDALYAAARLLGILSREAATPTEVFARLPQAEATPELLVPVAEGEGPRILERLAREADFGEGELNRLDGLRVEFADGWGLVRSSNTTPSLSLRFEADTPEALARIQGLFRACIQRAAPQLQLPF